MRSARGAGLALALALAATSLTAAATRFTVKYRSATSVYLDGGRAQGLSVGDRLQVAEGSKVVAELEVAYVAEASASCTVLSETRPVRSGDVAVLVGGASETAPAAEERPPAAASPTPVAPAAPAPSTAAAPRSGGRWARVRGSASLGYSRTWDQTESALDFQQTTGRLDLGLYDVAGQPLSFTLRLRSRHDTRARTLSQRTPQSERVDRLYEVALRYEPPSDSFAFELGRIGVSRFVGVGYLDGGLVRYRPLDDLQVGAFGGRIADIETLGFGGTGQKFGAFARLAPGGRYASRGYDVLLAYVHESADGDVSREYLSLESRLGGGRRFWLFERAELDLNRGWRQDLSGKSYQLSNLSLSANLRLTPSTSAFASYDGRRNYRSYRNRVVPEEAFDDLLHQGLRAGLNYVSAGGLGASAGFGMSLKEADPRHPELDVANAYSFSGSVRQDRILGSGFSMGLDVAGFSNGYTDGGLVTVRAARRLRGGHFLDLSWGRSFYRVKQSGLDRATQWLRLLGRAELGRRVYLQGDLEYDSGDDLKGPRAFFELGYLF